MTLPEFIREDSSEYDGSADYWCERCETTRRLADSEMSSPLHLGDREAAEAHVTEKHGKESR